MTFNEGSAILFALFAIICCALGIPLNNEVSEEDSYRHCELIEGSACKDLGYNFTSFPNIFKHENQLVALRELQEYYPLISIQCSPFLREFLCILYIPPCTEYGFHLPPCRSLCLKAKHGCENLRKFPEKFSCDNFPRSQELMCHQSNGDHKYYDPDKGPQKDLKQRMDVEEEKKILSTEESVEDRFMFCLNDSDCSVAGSVCRGGDCICEYPRAWGPLGCQLSQILGGHCESTMECIAVTPNAVCEYSICTCERPLTSYQNLSCIHGSEVGSLCYNDAQCRAVNKYSFCRFLVAQVVGTCACDPDQFVNSAGHCVPRLGGRCEKGKCSKELGKSACKRSQTGEFRCRCHKRAVESKGVCEFVDYD